MSSLSLKEQQQLGGAPLFGDSASKQDKGGSASITSRKSEIDLTVYRVEAYEASTDQKVVIEYSKLKTAGNGSFGVVMAGEMTLPRKGKIALKRTKQDRKFKNRELQIMKAMSNPSHPNIVKLLYYWHELPDPRADELHLNLIMEFLPETIYHTYRAYARKRVQFPEILCKLHLFQLIRAVSYLHSVGICHRDLKPHNVLTDPLTGQTVLIDFGSAKVLREGQPNVSYTCSRYYRAPELIFGSTTYSDSIDLWSIGCIMGELLQGGVLFPGASGIDQLVEIIKVLGTPTKDQVLCMNPSYSAHRFPQIQAVPLVKVLPKASPASLDLLEQFLQFDPRRRIDAAEALAASWFDELRAEGVTMPNGRPLPELWAWSVHEMSIRPDLIRRVIPSYAWPALAEKTGVDLRVSDKRDGEWVMDLGEVRCEID